MKDSEDDLGGKTYKLGVIGLELEGLVAGRGLEKEVHRDNGELTGGRDSTWKVPGDLNLIEAEGEVRPRQGIEF